MKEKIKFFVTNEVTISATIPDYYKSLADIWRFFVLLHIFIIQILMNILKLFFGVVGLFLLSQTLVAQPKIFVARLEHQTNQPEAFPNYFQNQAFTDSLTRLIKGWLAEKYKSQVIDFKKQNPVSYAPVILITEPIKSIKNTGYDWALSLITTLEYNFSKDRKKPSTGIMTCTTEFYDQDNRRFQRQKSKAEFIISENNAFYAEALISEDDFQKLYFTTLKALFTQQKPEKMVFRQPDDESAKVIIEKGSSLILNQLNRASFEMLSDISKQTISIQLNQPAQEAEKFDRSANFKNPFDQKDYLLTASLTGKRPDRVQITLFQANEVLGNIRSQTYTEEIQLIGKIDNQKVLMVRKENNLMVKFFVRDHLCAILAHQKGKYNVDAQYKLYFEPNISSANKVLIINLLATEVLVQALQKFHQIETEGIKRKTSNANDF